jgi:hypothetical protein
VSAQGAVPGIQIAHAGRKASRQRRGAIASCRERGGGRRRPSAILPMVRGPDPSVQKCGFPRCRAAHSRLPLAQIPQRGYCCTTSCRRSRHAHRRALRQPREPHQAGDRIARIVRAGGQARSRSPWAVVHRLGRRGWTLDDSMRSRAG